MARAPGRSTAGFAPIADYGLLGDERSAALVALDGAIDWLCLPDFGSPPVFARLLDPSDGGAFELRPAGPFEAERRYLEGTNVLETTFTTADGTVRVTDAMAVPATGPVNWSEIARKVDGVAGDVELVYAVRPRFEWREPAASIEAGRDSVVFRGDGLALVLQVWDAGEIETAGAAARGRFRLEAGSSAVLALTGFEEGPLAFFEREEIERRLDDTCNYWRSWLARCAYDGPWAEAVRRSALTLAALIHSPDGGIVAAPTTSLPERIGGDRNYDYRLCWVRDSCFALEAMLELGYRNQVHSSLTWMLGAVRRTHPRVCVLYDLNGSPATLVSEPPLAGYEGSKPVRSGNAAANQFQLGGYGDLLQTAMQFVDDGNRIDEQSGRMLGVVADHVARIWRKPDAGMWELQTFRHYAQAKVSAWMALDRAATLAERGAIPVPADRAAAWRAEAEAVLRFIDRRLWSADAGAYVQAPDREILDASILAAARFGLPRRDQLAATAAAARERLVVDGEAPLMYRYEGMEDEEGAFVACSFWLIEALARLGDPDEAAELMELMLPRANDLGLFSEEIDPADGSLLGNFPQAFSHLTLVTAAAALRPAAR
ncbi:MAG: glycoside hydrolase family 15 protein [Solirubrobacterales bacterium]